MVEAHGVEILNRVNVDGETVAHWACLRGNKVIVKYIIDMKGSLNEPTKNEVAQRPIHWACVNGHVPIVDLLLQVSHRGIVSLVQSILGNLHCARQESDVSIADLKTRVAVRPRAMLAIYML